MFDLAVIAIALAVVSAIRTRVERLPLTAPMLFVALGMVLSPDVTGVLDIDIDDETVALVAEITLALLLFSDAARIDVMSLRRSFELPARLLLIGLPLTVAMGTVVTRLLLPDLPWAAATLVAAILAPTDAALGQAVVMDKAIPVKIRQTLNVESGLNDGLVVPAVTVFTALAAGAALDSPSSIAGQVATRIGVGLVVGVGAGFILARASTLVVERGWTDTEGIRLTTFAFALGAFALTGVVGGNGFIAAFVAGLSLRAFSSPATEHDQVSAAIELAEDGGQVGASATFVLFGTLMVWPALDDATVPIVVCALATLTVGRMVPVAMALTGSELRAPTVAFLGWFGPRGLASMLFGLLLLAEGELGEAEGLFSIISLVVAASVVLHGVSAAPGARRYSRWFSANVGDESPIGRAGHDSGHDASTGGHEAMAEAGSMPESQVRWQRRPRRHQV